MLRKNLTAALACVCLWVAPAEGKVIVSLFQTGIDFNSSGNNDDWTIASLGPGNNNFDMTGNNTGDIELRVGGVPISMSSGVVLATPGPDVPALFGRSMDNITTPFADGSGNAWVSVVDNANTGGNPTITEENAGTAVAFFPYADGWRGGTYTQSSGSPIITPVDTGNFGDVVLINNPAGQPIFQITGLPTDGNLFAVPTGNAGTYGDNLASVANRGSYWEVQIVDNNSNLDNNAGFNLLYVPKHIAGVVSGLVDASAQNVIPLTTSLYNASISLNGDGFWELLLNDGTINPSNSALFLVGDITNNLEGRDNLMSYAVGIDNPLAFMILSDDAPLFDLVNEITADFRFLAVPFNTDLISFLPVPEPSSLGIWLAGLGLAYGARRRMADKRRAANQPQRQA